MRAKVRYCFPFFLLSLNLQDMLTIYPFRKKDFENMEFCTELLDEISNSEGDQWEKLRATVHFTNSKKYFKIKYYLKIFFMLLHKYMLFYTGNQNFKDFMPSVCPDLLMGIRKKAMVAIFGESSHFLWFLCL